MRSFPLDSLTPPPSFKMSVPGWLDRARHAVPRDGSHAAAADTPHYLAVAETPHRISDMYGGAESGLKFIVTLREPAGRAISSWEFKNEFNPKKGREFFDLGWVSPLHSCVAG